MFDHHHQLKSTSIRIINGMYGIDKYRLQVMYLSLWW